MHNCFLFKKKTDFIYIFKPRLSQKLKRKNQSADEAQPKRAEPLSLTMKAQMFIYGPGVEQLLVRHVCIYF